MPHSHQNYDCPLTAAQFHKKMAVEFFNETWKLLDKPERTVDDNVRMIHLAHASRLHWEFVGNAQNLAIGEWQVSRVHAVLRQAEAALFHATRCLEIAEQSGLSHFHIACAHEAVARSLAITNHPDAAQHIATARTLAAQITDADEKKILDEDLASIHLVQ